MKREGGELFSRFLFEDRQEAGRQLARALAQRQVGSAEPPAEGRAEPPGAGRAGPADTGVAHAQPPLILALPRGGVPVALEVAKGLRAPLDVLVVRKLGLPGHEELAVGAVASGGAQVLNEELVRELHVSEHELERVRKRELAELERREREYRGARPPLDVRGRAVVVVDDGVATGATMRVAVAALKQAGARHVTVAVPLASTDAARQLAREADALVCLATPEPFRSVGQWYRRFEQTPDAAVKRALAEAAGP